MVPALIIARLLVVAHDNRPHAAAALSASRKVCISWSVKETLRSSSLKVATPVAQAASPQHSQFIAALLQQAFASALHDAKANQKRKCVCFVVKESVSGLQLCPYMSPQHLHGAHAVRERMLLSFCPRPAKIAWLWRMFLTARFLLRPPRKTSVER